MFYYTIYQITNKLNGKVYIGKHQTKRLDDHYYGSGKKLLAAIKKYGKENFSKEILFVFETEQEMNDKEKEIITEEFVSRTDTYNVGIGGEGGPHFKGKKHTEETLQLIRERSGQPMSEYTKELLRQNNKRTNASRGAKNSAALKGRPKTEEHKQKIRESLLRRKNTAV
jgi:group I intron endonuclease